MKRSEERGKRPPGAARKAADFVPGTSRPKRNVAETEIEKAIFGGGRTIELYAVLPSGLALRRTAAGLWVAAVASDKDLSRAVSRYLRQRGVRVLTPAEALAGR